MSSRAFLLLGLVAAMFLLISSEFAAARDLAETSTEKLDANGLNDQKYGGGYGGGGYGRGGGGYGGGGYGRGGGGYGGGGYGRGGRGGGYGGGRGRCGRYGCCGGGYNCRCCASAAEAAEYAAKQVKPQN